MRIALARLLLEQRSHMGKSLLLLDEPTNHLDTKAKVVAVVDAVCSCEFCRVVCEFE
jgi:ABC-type transport system involved in cytochrome bd biosynthesis fused ATPase/permease subunit